MLVGSIELRSLPSNMVMAFRQLPGPLSMGRAIESIETCFSPKEVDSKMRYGVTVSDAVG